MPRRSNDPRDLLRKPEEVPEDNEWAQRTDSFDTTHAQRIWDTAFSKSLEVILDRLKLANDLTDKTRMVTKGTKLACEYADIVLDVYSNHRQQNKGVFVAAAERMNAE